MGKMAILASLVLAGLVCIGLYQDYKVNEALIKPGDCVRLLGLELEERVTVVTAKGAIETRWLNPNSGKYELSAYDMVEATRLVKVECKNEIH